MASLFKVTLRSAPGMWAQYEGDVQVFSENEDTAFADAVRKLARSSFPDRPSLTSWICQHIERIKE